MLPTHPRTAGASQGPTPSSGPGNPTLPLCHDLSIRRENFATGLMTVQMLLLSVLEIFGHLAETERRESRGLTGLLRKTGGRTLSQGTTAPTAPGGPSPRTSRPHAESFLRLESPGIKCS